MAKKKSDYLKMMELGEWLEEVFNINIKWWQYDDLFKEAKRVLNADFFKDLEEKFLKGIKLPVRVLEYISKNSLEKYYIELWEADLPERVYHQIPNDKSFHPAHNILMAEKDPLKLAQVAQEKRIEHHLIEEPNNGEEHQKALAESLPLIDSCMEFLLCKLYALSWLKETVDSDTQLKIRFKDLYDHPGFTDHYNGLQINLYYDENEGFVRTFEVTEKKTAGFYHYEPIEVLFCRIFIDFLMLGGLEYYGFCKQCDNFFLTQRKGRKKFCSDSCRVEHFRKQHTT